MKNYAGRYKILKHLGVGSIGSVLHVQDVKTGIEYALKTLPATSALSIDLESFLAEFDVLKNLNHPNICQVYDAGFDKEDESYYLATELVAGQDLFDATENLTIDQIEELFVQALRAFNYLHQKSVIHLDVKPQNMLVADRRSRLKLIDFGFANLHKRAKQKNSIEKDKHLIIGTAAYVAPEIIGSAAWDGRADLYSLGVSFYKAFARRLPFEA